MTRLMLLDGNGLIYRGYYALIATPLTTSKGELVNAVFGFTNIVLRAIGDVKPDAVAIAFDLGKPTFRHERYLEYKATRQRMPDELRDQFPKVREVVAALGIPVYEREGFEADDVIATLAGQAEARGLETTIVTGDLDMLQLVTERTRLVVSLRGGVANTVVYDLARMAERWGLRPDQMLDYKALKGDATDNIPGVPGVGEKTAAKLVATFGTLDGLYERLDEVTPERLRPLLLEARERVLESRELQRLVADVPVELDLDAARLGVYDRDAVVGLFREYEFRSLIDRLPPLRGETADEAASLLRVTAGDPELAFQDLVTFAKSVYEAPISQQYDIAIGGVGFPKDSNLYQASRAPSYLAFAPTPVVRPGGFYIIPARCEEGAGSGVGEQRFLAAMRDAPNVQFILDDARRNGYPPGQQRAFVMAKVLEQARVVIVGSECPDLVAACKMIPALTMGEALALASRELGESCKVLIVPHAMLTLPVVQPESHR